MPATVEERLAWLEGNLTQVRANDAGDGSPIFLAAADADTFWLIWAGVTVFFMQCGFGMLEAGSVRAKNTRNIMIKNLLDACLGAIIWFGVGYAVAYDGMNPFIGVADETGFPSFVLYQGHGATESAHGSNWAGWWFQYVFAAAATTIVSGAVAERAQLIAYLTYTCAITCFVYPVVVHWVWSSGGWLSCFNGAGEGGANVALRGGMIDFAGSGVVHMTGGVAALCGAKIIGPRSGRFVERKPVPMPGHSSVLQVLGTFTLWMGWYGFNPGSTLGIASAHFARDAARSVVTTTLAAAGGAITVVLLGRFTGGIWDVGCVCNGILAGLVSITAGCSTITCGLSLLTGILGGGVYFGASKLVVRALIDDPLDAFAVHGACGLWGVLAVGLFASPDYGYNAEGAAGLFYGGPKAGVLLGVQLCGIVVQILWTSVTSSTLFFALKAARLLRIDVATEEDGIDVEKHGGPGYALTEEWPPKVTETPKSESVSEVANGERRSVTFAAGKGISEKAFAPAAGPSSSSSQAGPSAERL